jgi:hypothetical protein
MPLLAPMIRFVVGGGLPQIACVIPSQGSVPVIGNHAGPNPPLPLEADLDADLAQEGRRPPPPARQCPRAIGPALRLGDALAF